MSIVDLQKTMLKAVAQALGDDLLSQVVFVGGCTTGLLVTDSFTKEQVRFTDDVDLIVNVIGYTQWSDLQQKLRLKGFSDDMSDPVICRMLLGDLKVDFMPVDERTLGFSNRWYKDAVNTASVFDLTEGIAINLVSPEYFIATKLEAYLGRGKNDALSSHDIEDLLNIFDGRPEIVGEILLSPAELQQYISQQLDILLSDNNFEYAIQSLTNGDQSRESLIFERIKAVVHE